MRIYVAKISIGYLETSSNLASRLTATAVDAALLAFFFSTLNLFLAQMETCMYSLKPSASTMSRNVLETLARILFSIICKDKLGFLI